MNEQLCDIASKFETTTPRTSSWQRIIRCRYNLQWVFQKGTSADLNKGHWVGLSYHASWASLKARYPGVREALNANLKSDAVAKDDVVLDDVDGQT